MRGNILLLLPILFPVAAGILVLMGKGFGANRSRLAGVVFLTLAASAAFTGLALAKGGSLTLWQLTDYAVIEFCIDQVAGLFAVLTAVVWLLVGLYSFSYMVHEREEYQFFGWYLIVLGVLVGLDQSVTAAGGYLIQLLPGASEDMIEKIEAGVRAIGPVSAALAGGLDGEGLLRAVLKDFDLEVLEKHPVEYRCCCSRDRVSRALISMGRKELSALIQEQGRAELTCQFCDQVYQFSREELEQLLEKM